MRTERRVSYEADEAGRGRRRKRKVPERKEKSGETQNTGEPDYDEKQKT